MAITATFDADFAPFIRGVNEAEGELKGFEGAAESAADELDQFAVQTVKASGETSSLGSEFRKVDSILGTMGINIGKEARAVEELATMFGLGTEAMALFTVGATAVGTAVLLWKNLDTVNKVVDGSIQAVSDYTAKLMGWGDVAKETALAQADATNALKAHAPEAARSLAEMTAGLDVLDRRNASLAAFAAKQDAATEKEKAAAAPIREHAAAVKALVDEALGADQIKKAALWTEAIEQLGGALDRLSNEQLKTVRAEMQAAIDAMARNGMVTDESVAQYAALIVQIDQLTGSYSAVTAATETQADAQLEAAAANDAYLAKLYELNAAEKESAKIKAEAAAAANSIVGKQFGIRPGASEPLTGNEYYQQHLAGSQSGLFGTPYVEPAWVQMMRESAATVNNTFNIVDTESNIARRVSDQITRSITSSTAVRPV